MVTTGQAEAERKLDNASGELGGKDGENISGSRNHEMKPDKRKYVLNWKKREIREWAHLVVLTLTLAAAAAAAYEASRLADLTNIAIGDARKLAKKQAIDTQAALATAKQAADSSTVSSTTAQQNLVASQRAWVGPSDAKLDGTLKLGQPIDIVVSFMNTGREPARGFVSDLDAFAATADDEKKGIAQTRIVADFDKCNATQSSPPAQVIYPSNGFNNYTIRKTIDKAMIDEGIIDGTKTIIAQGCFVYTTFQQVHRSTFCYYFKSGVTKPDHLNICIVGHYAD